MIIKIEGRGVVYVCYSFCILNEIYIFGYLDFLSLCLFSCLLCATSLEILKTVLNLCSKYPISNNAYINFLNHGSVARNCFFGSVQIIVTMTVQSVFRLKIY